MRFKRSKKFAVGATLIVLLLLVALGIYLKFSNTTPHSSAITSAHSTAQPYWIWLDSDLTHLVSAGFPQQDIQYFFNNPHTLIIDSGGTNNSAIIKDLPNALLIQKFDSETDLEKAIDTQTLYPNVTYVGYDAAFWAWVRKNLTSAADLNKIAGAGATTAHEHGLKLFYEIPEIVAPQFTQTPSGDKFTDFLQENLAGQGAAISDIFEIETQSLQDDTNSFDSFATQSLAQAHATNPNIPLLLGLTTYDANGSKTEQSLAAAYAATHTITDGYWINGVNTNAAPAVLFLEQLYAEQH